MKSLKLLLFVILNIISTIPLAARQDEILLRRGTVISVVIKQEVRTNRKASIPKVEVAGDVYDEAGEYILIKKGTPVDVYMNVTRPSSIEWEAGVIEITPISTTAVDGRLINFREQKERFEGRENSLFRLNAIIKRNTSIVATIANDYIFIRSKLQSTLIE